MGFDKEIPEIIADHAALFAPFEHVYLFGSVLFPPVIPNDVDLLLIYTHYTPEISSAVKDLSCKLEQILDLPIDLTVLSIDEERDTEFLKKIKLPVIKIK